MRTLADLMVDEFTKAETRAWQEHLDAVATAAATARPTASRSETVTNARQPTTELTIATCHRPLKIRTDDGHARVRELGSIAVLLVLV